MKITNLGKPFLRNACMSLDERFRRQSPTTQVFFEIPMSEKRLRIIGAGMSGLLAAFYAVEKGFSVEIVEKKTEVGGKIHTLKSPHGLIESAANAFMVDQELERVALKIGVVLIEKNKNSEKSFYLLQQ